MSGSPEQVVEQSRCVQSLVSSTRARGGAMRPIVLTPWTPRFSIRIEVSTASQSTHPANCQQGRSLSLSMRPAVMGPALLASGTPSRLANLPPSANDIDSFPCLPDWDHSPEVCVHFK